MLYMTGYFNKTLTKHLQSCRFTGVLKKTTPVKKLIVFLTSSLFSLNAFAQAPNEKINQIDNEFVEILENSNNFQEYKVVKQSSLLNLKKNTNTYILELQNTINNNAKSHTEKDKAMADLKASQKNIQEELDQVKGEKNSISFLGIQLDKSIYNGIVWSIIAILILVLVTLIIKFKTSNAITIQSKTQLQQVEDELEELRRRSIEKEQILGRQLQDERNKLSRLKNAQ